MLCSDPVSSCPSCPALRRARTAERREQRSSAPSVTSVVQNTQPRAVAARSRRGATPRMDPLPTYVLLAEGGQIFMRMEQTFFAHRFAMMRDRFGTS